MHCKSLSPSKGMRTTSLSSSCFSSASTPILYPHLPPLSPSPSHPSRTIISNHHRNTTMTTTSPTKENAPPSPETPKTTAVTTTTAAVTPKSQRPSQRPGQPTDQAIGLYVARYHHNAAHKHWTLFVDGPTPSTCVQHQILGPNARTYFEHAKTVGEHPADDPELVQLSFLCNVSAANFDAIAAIAEGVPVYRYRREWDAQVYVLDVIEALESARVIDVPAGQVELYQEFKGVIQGYLEEGCVPPLRGLWDRSLWGVGEW